MDKVIPSFLGNKLSYLCCYIVFVYVFSSVGQTKNGRKCLEELKNPISELLTQKFLKLFVLNCEERTKMKASLVFFRSTVVAVV